LKKKLKIIIPIILLTIVIVSYMFYQKMMKPIYAPGNVSKGIHLSSSLIPPKQMTNTETMWQVETDIYLNYFTQGEGRNVLVIHGGPGMPYAEPWPGLEPLTNQYKFNYYDQRGSGKSTRPISSFSSNNYYQNMIKAEESLGLTAQIADIERIRHILKEEKLIIIGHSFGSVIASLYAAEFPENIEALVLVAPAPLLKMPMKTPGLFDSIEKELEGEQLVEYQAFVKEYLNFKDVFSKTDEELTQQNMTLGKYFELVLKNHDVTLPINGKPSGWGTQAIYLSMGQKHDYTDAISQAKVPTLIIHTGNDVVQAEEASRTYLDVFPHAEFVVIEDAGHMAFYDEPIKFGNIVSNFLKHHIK